MSEQPRLLIDMDNTIVDLFANTGRDLFDHPPCRWHFTGCCTELTEHEVFSDSQMFLDAPPIPGAIAGVRKLMAHFDVRFVSTPWPTSDHLCAAYKYRWIGRQFGCPSKLTLTHDKALISGAALIDDKPDLVGPWEHITYPQKWNDGAKHGWPTWSDGLADEVIDEFAR